MARVATIYSHQGEALAEVVMLGCSTLTWTTASAASMLNPEEFRHYARVRVTDQKALCARPTFLEPT